MDESGAGRCVHVVPVSARAGDNYTDRKRTLSSVWRSSKKHSFAPASRSMVWARARVDVKANTVAATRDHSEARMVAKQSDQQIARPANGYAALKRERD